MMPVDGHLKRIEREAGVPGLAEALAAMAPTDLKSLLLHVFERHAERRDPAALLAQYERDGTVGAAASNHALDAAALRAAEGFEPVELAPVAPLGLNAVLGRIHQNNVLSTIRTTEVVADPTASLALEAALRRRNGEPLVRLCTLGRILRLQPVPDLPGYTPHFRLFALVTAGRARPSHGFEREALTEHLAVYRRLLDGLGIAGYRCEVAGEPRLEIPGTSYDPERRSTYYDGPMLQIWATDGEGVSYPLADGGRIDWTQRLLANRKERLLTSAIGISLVSQRFSGA
jgi:hypothetical protein